MIYSRLYTVPLCGFIALLCFKITTSAETITEPKVTHIRLHNEPWNLIFRGDGSARLFYGDGGPDGANTEIGAYDLPVLARKIRPLLKLEPSGNKIISVSISNEIDPRYLEDEETFLELFSEVLHRAHVSDVPRMRALLKYRPLFMKGKQLDIAEDQTANWQRGVVARRLQAESGGGSTPSLSVSSGSNNYILKGTEPPGILWWLPTKWRTLGIIASALLVITLLFRRIRKSRRTADA